jgi:FMN phosphatase YigB (HAD superfamily)
MNLSDKIKYLLFDLDGTLLHFDLDEFVAGYLSLIRQEFESYPWGDKVPEWILTGTDLMLNNKGSKTNQAIFLEYFTKKSGLSAEDVWSKFMTFYEQKFDNLQTISQQDKNAIDTIEKALQAGYQLVLATQPIFPEIAIRKRLAWAGLDHIPFLLITDIEKMSACKPAELFFEEVMSYIGAKSSECLMIGNDPITDMAAVRKDILTFFITDHNDQSVPPEANYSGKFSDLAKLLHLS